MALNVCRLFDADWGIAITGYATPIPEQSINNLFAYFCITEKGRVLQAEKVELPDLNTLEAQIRYTHEVLEKLSVLLDTRKTTPRSPE